MSPAVPAPALRSRGRWLLCVSLLLAAGCKQDPDRHLEAADELLRGVELSVIEDDRLYALLRLCEARIGIEGAGRESGRASRGAREAAARICSELIRRELRAAREASEASEGGPPPAEGR